MKLSSRIVALLLVPCLAGDALIPAGAARVGGDSTSLNIFEEKALSFTGSARYLGRGAFNCRAGIAALTIALSALLFQTGHQPSRTTQPYTIVNTPAVPLPGFGQFKADLKFYWDNHYMSPLYKEAYDRARPAIVTYLEKDPEVLLPQYHKQLGIDWQDVYDTLTMVAGDYYETKRPPIVFQKIRTRYPETLLAYLAEEALDRAHRKDPVLKYRQRAQHYIENYLKFAHRPDTSDALKDLVFQRIAYLLSNFGAQSPHYYSADSPALRQDQLEDLARWLLPKVRGTWLELYIPSVVHGSAVWWQLKRPNPFLDARRTEQGLQFFQDWIHQFDALISTGRYPLHPFGRHAMSEWKFIEDDMISGMLDTLDAMGQGGHLSREQWTFEIEQLYSLVAKVLQKRDDGDARFLLDRFLSHLGGGAKQAQAVLGLLERLHLDPELDTRIEPLLTHIGSTINQLHDQGDIRGQAQLIAQFPDWVLYRIIANGRELYTSSFLVLEGEMHSRIERNHQTLTQWLLVQDPSSRYLSGFLLSLGQFQKLGPALTSNPELRQVFLKTLDTAELSDLFLLAPALHDLMHGSTLTWRSDLEQRVYDLAAKGNGRVGQAWRLFLLKEQALFSARWQAPIKVLAQSLPPEFVKLGGSSQPPYTKLFGNGVMVSELFFSQEEHYHAFIDLFQKPPSNALKAYRLVSQDAKTTVLEKTVAGRRLRVVATLDFSNLKETLLDPSVGLVAHRGHSYQVRNVFPENFLVERELIIYLGSCGGFRDLPSLLVKEYPNGLPFAVTRTGIGQINNIFLFYLLEGLAHGQADAWTWDQIRAYIRPHLAQRLVDFVFPYDLPVLMMRVPEPTPSAPKPAASLHGMSQSSRYEGTLIADLAPFGSWGWRVFHPAAAPRSRHGLKGAA